jgi:hypothetical protein
MKWYDNNTQRGNPDTQPFQTDWTLPPLGVDRQDVFSTTLDRTAELTDPSPLFVPSADIQEPTIICRLMNNTLQIGNEGNRVYKLGAAGIQTAITLPPSSYRLLLYLGQHPGFHTRRMILEAVWDTELYEHERRVDTTVYRVRQKLGKYSIQGAQLIGYAAGE